MLLNVLKHRFGSDMVDPDLPAQLLSTCVTHKKMAMCRQIRDEFNLSMCDTAKMMSGQPTAADRAWISLYCDK